MKDKLYDWADYYEELYRREKLNNNKLAAKLGDEQRREGDLRVSLNRVEGSIFWKALKPARVIGRIFTGKVDVAARLSKGLQGNGHKPSKEFLAAYERELALQQNPYMAWKKLSEERISDFLKENAGQDVLLDICVINWDSIEFNKNPLNTIKAEAEAAQYVLLSKGNCRLTDSCLEVLSVYADRNRQAALFYWDEQNWFKPEFSVETLLSEFYFGSGILIRADYIEKYASQILDTGFNFVYELALLIMQEQLEGGKEIIVHIPLCLTEMGFGELDMPGSDFFSLPVRERAIERLNWTGNYSKGVFAKGQDGWTMQFVPQLPAATSVSAVILSKDHPEVLRRLLVSIYEKTDFDFDKLQLIVVDNGSSEENKAQYESMAVEFNYQYIYEPAEFNFSAMCNKGAREATGDCLLLLNDDIEVLQKDWLKLLAGTCLVKGVGAVGAKLLYAGTDKLQHAGVTNLKVGPSHKLVTFSDDEVYYHGANRLTINMLAVTAACLMIERKKYVELGGLDERFKVAYNDVEFCFRVSKAGYRNVQCNGAVLYHYESLTRGLDEDSDEKWDRLLAEKERLYSLYPEYCGKDPFYNESLVDNAPDYRVEFKFPYQNHLYVTRLINNGAQNEKIVIPKRTNENVLKLTVDHARLQRKIHNSEDFICLIDGWEYLTGIDNAGFEKKLVLQNIENKEIFYARPVDWYREDVCQILPGETNVGLSGFSLRFVRDELKAGEYKIGLLLDREGEKYFAWSDKSLKI